jgi:hypothetical protein
MNDRDGVDGTYAGGRSFYAVLGVMDDGVLRAEIEPAPPLQTVQGHERDMASLVHAVAAALEERCQELGADWAIFPDPFGGRVDVEIPDGQDREQAAEVVAGVLSDLGLV